MRAKIKERDGIWGLFATDTLPKDCHKIQWEKGMMQHCTSQCMMFDLVAVDKVEESAVVKIYCGAEPLTVDCDMINEEPKPDVDYSLSQPAKSVF